VEPEKTGSEDRGYVIEALVGIQLGRVEVGSHGRLQEGEAHSDVHEVVGRVPGGFGARAPLLIYLPAEFEMTQEAQL
jgi:hypothetical protein